MNIIAKYYGGSTSYGLATPESDLDVRFVFLNTDYSKIIGLDRYEHECRQSNGEDSFGWELRHYLNLLKNGNTMCLEMLYNDNWIELSEEFKLIQSERNNLIDSHKLYKCLKGYCHSERRLVLGERTGVLGGKRRTHLEKYGYSYKNLIQFLRLCLAGSVFFKEGYFPVNIREVDKYNVLFSIKTHPEICNKEEAIKMMEEYETKLNEAYNDIQFIYHYDCKIANELCYRLYMPILDNVKF